MTPAEMKKKVKEAEETIASHEQRIAQARQTVNELSAQIIGLRGYVQAMIEAPKKYVPPKDAKPSTRQAKRASARKVKAKK